MGADTGLLAATLLQEHRGVEHASSLYQLLPQVPRDHLAVAVLPPWRRCILSIA